MITAIIPPEYILIAGLAFPIHITNDGTSTVIATLQAQDTLFTSTTIDVPAATTSIVYATTQNLDDTITINAGGETIELPITLQVNMAPYTFGDNSYISAFQIPGDIPSEVLPKLENIHLLMYSAKYFKSPGELKVWKPEV